MSFQSSRKETFTLRKAAVVRVRTLGIELWALSQSEFRKGTWNFYWWVWLRQIIMTYIMLDNQVADTSDFMQYCVLSYTAALTPIMRVEKYRLHVWLGGEFANIWLMAITKPIKNVAPSYGGAASFCPSPVSRYNRLTSRRRHQVIWSCVWRTNEAAPYSIGDSVRRAAFLIRKSQKSVRTWLSLWLLSLLADCLTDVGEAAFAQGVNWLRFH